MLRKMDLDVDIGWIREWWRVMREEGSLHNQMFISLLLGGHSSVLLTVPVPVLIGVDQMQT